MAILIWLIEYLQKLGGYTLNKYTELNLKVPVIETTHKKLDKDKI